MKFSLRPLLSALIALSALAISAQSVTTNPVTIEEGSSDIIITFHSDGGNRGLVNATESTAIYAHTGVITNKSKDLSAWRYATNWETPDAKHKLTYVAPFTWQLTIPDIRSFYGISDPTEVVEKLAFVFRDASGDMQGKSSLGGDIFVEVFPSGFPKESTAAEYPGGIPGMGAQRNGDGTVTFCIAAPEKKNIVLIGSWNGYSIKPEQLMNYQDYQGTRYFWTNISGLEDGKDYIYYYLVDGTVRVGDPYANLVLDPFNDQYISQAVFPNLPAYPAEKISGVPLAVYNPSLNDYDWQVSEFKGVGQSELIVYELLIRDFTGTEGQSNGEGTVRGVIEKLDYIKDLGVNAIELLPIMEFSGNNSWGYNTNFYMAPDKAYGTPDDYRELIDRAHQLGMAVILDIVFNQADGMHPWYDMYRRNITPFFNGSSPHAYSVLNDWNQDCALVQQQWRDALNYWMTAYKVDGFRFDLVKGLGNNDSYSNTYYPETNTWGTPDDSNTNRYNASRIARMKELRDYMATINPDSYFINENLAYAEEENAMAADGEINWANVNYGARQYVMGQADGSSLNRFYAPLDDKRLWGSTVSYAESHDEQRVAYGMYSDKASIVRGNTPYMCRRIGSMAAQMLLCPGAHMIWQFEELGNEQSTKNGSGNNTDPKKVNWKLLDNPDRRGLYDSYAMLCDLRKKYPELFREGAATTVDLSSMTARYICLSSGSKELYLVVNPAAAKPDNTATIPYPKNPSTGETAALNDPKYSLLAKSYSVEPALTPNGVALPAGAFAVYGANLESGIDDIENDCGKTVPVISVDGRRINVHNPYTTFSIYNLGGVSLPVESELAPGIYIVNVDSYTVKVAVM